MMFRRRLGFRVRALRHQRGLTQEALAELIDRSVDAVSSWERGKNLPDLDTLERTAKALDVSLREFFDFPDDARTSPLRAALIATVIDAVRALPDPDLQVAAEQIAALARHHGAKAE